MIYFLLKKSYGNRNIRMGRISVVTSSMLEGRERIYKVYLITMDKIDQHWYSVDKGAADMAAIAGNIEYIWDAPYTKNEKEQIEILNNAVIEGADLIMIAATDPIAISTAIEDAKSKGVQIIYLDSLAYEEAIITLSTDNYGAGRTAGEVMVRELEAEGMTSGSIGIIGVNTSTNSTMNRETGFRDAIRTEGSFMLLPTIYAEGDMADSRDAAMSLFQENQDLVGIFGTNEGSTEGVGQAIKTADRKIVGIGFDKSETILDLVREGSLKAVMAQNPYTMGYLGMAEAIAALKGYDTGPELIDTGVAILTR